MWIKYNANPVANMTEADPTIVEAEAVRPTETPEVATPPDTSETTTP